jgi:enamine deaminase RidA (YjgF/YER057c/UK114 family)
MDARRTIVPPALQPVYDMWHFAPAVAVNGLVFCSGIVGTSPDGAAPELRGPLSRRGLGSGAALDGAVATLDAGAAPLSDLQAVRDPEAQFATAFEALEEVLVAAGATLADVVELTSYHVEIGRHMDAFMRVKDLYLGEPYPAWTAVGVSELVVPGGLVELRAVAAPTL